MSILGSLATWWFWAYYAAGLVIMTSVLALHLHKTARSMSRGPWLLVIGGALGALGAIIGGMQAGPYPPLHTVTGVAVIRLCWVTGITFGVAAAALYLWGLKEKRV